MSGDIVERLRRWDDGGVSTHYDGCIDTHWRCAILFAADTIEARDAEIVRLRALIVEWDAAREALLSPPRHWDESDWDMACTRRTDAICSLTEEACRER